MEQISVVIPTYNREASIVKAIESVLNQTYPIHEVIVVDDGSTDNTEKVVCQIPDSRVKYFKTPENHGAGAARNYGVRLAACELIAFHDSDDEWLPEKIEKQMKYLEEHPDSGLVYTAFTAYSDNRTFDFPPHFKENSNIYGGCMLRTLLMHNTIGTPTVLIHKNIFEELGGFDEHMNALEDWDFAIRTAEKYPIGFVAEACVKVSLRGKQMSESASKHYANNCYILRKHSSIYIRENLLDTAVKEILSQAEQDGIGAQVEKLLLLYFQNT